jgi:hypothetical protein
MVLLLDERELLVPGRSNAVDRENRTPSGLTVTNASSLPSLSSFRYRQQMNAREDASCGILVA